MKRSCSKSERSVNIHGLDSIEPLLRDGGYLFKLVANEQAVLLFPASIEHRDATRPGLRYQDDSAGNALAAMVKPGRIEFRLHRGFSDERVRLLARRMLGCPELAFAAGFAVTYQGRTLIAGDAT